MWESAFPRVGVALPTCGVHGGLFEGHGAEHLYLALGKWLVPEAELGDADFLLLAVVVDEEEEVLRQLPVHIVGPDASAHLYSASLRALRGARLALGSSPSA